MHPTPAVTPTLLLLHLCLNTLRIASRRQYQNGHDIAKSLRDGKLLDLTKDEPQRDIASDPDEAKQKTLQDGLDLKYQARITLHTTREQVLKANCTKAYALIMDDYCTKAMRNCIQEHPNFASKIQDDPFELLVTIKSCLHEPVRAQYPMISLVDHLATLLTCKQQPDEQLIEWSKRFKQYLDLAIEQVGKDGINHYVETSESYVLAAHPPVACPSLS